MNALGEMSGVAVGMLTERVAIRRRDVADDGQGGTMTTWFPLATVWARVTTLSGRVAMAADARGSVVTHTVVLRYRADIGAGDRFVWQGRTLDILSAGDLNGRRAWLSCACSEQSVTG